MKTRQTLSSLSPDFVERSLVSLVVVVVVVKRNFFISLNYAKTSLARQLCSPNILHLQVVRRFDFIPTLRFPSRSSSQGAPFEMTLFSDRFSCETLFKMWKKRCTILGRVEILNQHDIEKCMFKHLFCRLSCLRRAPLSTAIDNSCRDQKVNSCVSATKLMLSSRR